MAFIRKNLFLILLFVFSVLVPFALGMGPAFYGILASFLIFIVLHRLSYWAFAPVFLFVLITCILFLPQVIWYGHPPVTMIGAFFETDFKESQEFMQSLPFYSYFSSILLLLFGLWVLYLGKKAPHPHLFNRKSLGITLGLLLLSIILTLYRPIKASYTTDTSFHLHYSRTAIISFYASIYSSIKQYRADKEELEKGIEGQPSWEITAIQPEYQNYVLVVGESVRRDYMSLYGFPLENSTFLKEVKGTIVEGYTAVAPNTYPSLTRTFIQLKDNDFLYANNIITLAQSAGFETFWFSNQGYAGEFDTPISKIANLCDVKIFTKKTGYDTMNYYDSQLLPVLDKHLKQPSDKPRLFVLHLAGSHQSFKARLETPIHFDFINSNMSAYIQTIEQTDTLLKNIYTQLKSTHKPFSMLYFSDHGLMTQDRETPFFTTLSHADTDPKKSAYIVPFALISSNDTEHKHLKVEKSAYHFLSGFAHWLGIKESSLSNSYQFLTPVNDTLKVFNHKENVLYHSLEDDPVIFPK